MAGAAKRALRCGLVGPGRTRQGLGPFLARDLEAVGCAVVAVSGRDPARARAAADDLAREHGHAIDAFADTEAMLAAHALDALVIAAPIAGHLPALRAAAAAEVAVLCEKPLVSVEETDEIDEVLDRLVAAGRPVMENCQLPYILPAFRELHPDAGDEVRAFSMRLSPPAPGRTMLVESLSHFISLVQALVPIGAGTRLTAVDLIGAEPTSRRLEVSLGLESPFPTLAATLYLEVCEAQPRPAWIEVNGLRGERQIEIGDYSMSLHGDGRSVPLPDPLAALVHDFVHFVAEPDLDRVRAESQSIRDRAGIYRAVLDAWDLATD